MKKTDKIAINIANKKRVKKWIRFSSTLLRNNAREFVQTEEGDVFKRLNENRKKLIQHKTRQSVYAYVGAILDILATSQTGGVVQRKIEEKVHKISIKPLCTCKYCPVHD